MRKKLFIIGAGASKQIPEYLTGLQLLETVKTYFLSIEPHLEYYINVRNTRITIREKIQQFDGKEDHYFV